MNHIEISFRSPTQYIRKAFEQTPAGGSEDAMVGFPFLRKAHCMFGWDWGPRLPDAGIWRDISILEIDIARIDDVLVLQHHEENRVCLEIQTHIHEITGTLPVTVTVMAPSWKQSRHCLPLLSNAAKQSFNYRTEITIRFYKNIGRIALN